MIIKSSADIRQRYNEVERLCKETQEPVYLTKNGQGNLVVMDIQAFEKRERMLELKEKLIDVERNRTSGKKTYSLEELSNYLDQIIERR